MKLHTIIPGKLFQRGEFDHFSADEVNRVLASKNIQTVIGVGGTHYQKPLHAHYVFRRIPDSANLNAPMVLELAATVYEHGKHAAFLTHCHAGRNRSGLISALLVVAMTGISGERAIDIVRRGRRNALANDTFVNFLTSVRTYNPITKQYELS